MGKKTLEQYILEARKVHGDKYDKISFYERLSCYRSIIFRLNLITRSC